MYTAPCLGPTLIHRKKRLQPPFKMEKATSEHSFLRFSPWEQAKVSTKSCFVFKSYRKLMLLNHVNWDSNLQASEERQEADKSFDPRWSTEQWWLPQMWVKGTLDWLLSLVCSTGEVSFTSMSFLGSPVNSYKGRCWDLTGKGHKATLGICFLASPDGYTVTSTIFLSESPDAKTDFIICKLLSMKFLHKETSHFKSNLPKLESFMCSLPSSHPLDSFIKQNGNNNATLRTWNHFWLSF